MEEEDIILLRSILNSRANIGTTIAEMKVDFNELAGYVPDFFSNSYKIIHDYLQTVPGLQVKVQNGLNLWYSINEKSRHIADMIVKQKPSKYRRITDAEEVPETVKCYFQDNYKYKQRKSYWGRPYSLSSQSESPNSSFYSSDSDHKDIANFYGFEMAGDDFFLDIARAHNNIYTGRKRLKKLGLCISGQTIRKLTKRIKALNQISENLLINIGTVDILQGRDLLDMQQDFCELLNELRHRNTNSFFTTIAPLANCFYQTEVKKKLGRFNQFLKRNCHSVIDISSCFLNEHGKIMYDFYQPGPVYVAGSSQPHVLWNKLGQTNVIRILKSSMADIWYGDAY